jgi:hypothetical protein
MKNSNFFLFMGFQHFKLTSFEGGICVWGKCEKVFNKLSKMDFRFCFFNFWVLGIQNLGDFSSMSLCLLLCVHVKTFGVFWCFFFGCFKILWVCLE